MKLQFATFLFLFIVSLGYTQINDNSILKKLSNISLHYKNQKKIDSAIHFTNELLLAAEKIKDTSYILIATERLAVCNRKNNNPFNAVRYYLKSKDLNLMLGDTTTAIANLRFIASIQNTLGDYSSSESTSIEALTLSKTLPDSISKKHQLGLLNNLGITTGRQMNYLDAIEWYNEAMELTADKKRIIGIKNNIALAQIHSGNYEKAKNILYEIIKEPLLEKNKNLKARIMDNLANVKAKMKNPEAEKELLAALEIRKEIDDLNGQFASNIHLAEYYKNQKQNNKALNHANEAYKIAEKLQSDNSKLEALNYIIKLKDNPNKEAIEYVRITDSIMIARNRAKNQFAKIRYEADKYKEQVLVEQKTNAQQEYAIEKQKNQKLILITLISLLVPTIGFVIYYLVQKSKTDRIRERHSTEKRLSKKLHDEVGNDVFYLMSQLINETEISPNTNKNNVIKGLDAVYHKVRDFSRNNTVETGPEYEYELRSLLNSYGNDKTRMITNKLENDFWFEVSDYKKTELYWILKELLTNMKKHSEASIVSINIAKEKKTIIVKYADNGKGSDLSNLSQKMNGLCNVRNRIKDIKGTITFDTKPNKGFKSVIKFSL